MCRYLNKSLSFKILACQNYEKKRLSHPLVRILIQLLALLPRLIQSLAHLTVLIQYDYFLNSLMIHQV